MKLSKYFQRFCVGLATMGLLVPNFGVLRADEKAATAVRAAPAVVDVSLSDGGVLRGQVVNPQGKALADTAVTLHRGQTEVASTKTDAKGNFALTGVKGGVYSISTAGVEGVVRAWSPNTAPPSSVAGILLVPQEMAARAQLGGGNRSLGALLIVGFAATVIAVAIDHNSAS